MSTNAATIDFILSRLVAAGSVTAKKMFGEYGLYLEGKMLALVCDDQFFLKPTPAGRAYWPGLEEGPPYPGAKPCLMLSENDFVHAIRVAELLRITWDNLPLPKPKTPRPGKKK